ncbi:hypothetical protein [Amycolatopsis palatopharyngis]|nr:hypothetical protein [Amycolatopsis palatopharyngis]
MQQLVRRISGWQDLAGQGAGSPVQVAAPARREAAKALERRQRNN